MRDVCAYLIFTHAKMLFFHYSATLHLKDIPPFTNGNLRQRSKSHRTLINTRVPKQPHPLPSNRFHGQATRHWPTETRSFQTSWKNRWSRKRSKLSSPYARTRTAQQACPSKPFLQCRNADWKISGEKASENLSRGWYRVRSPCGVLRLPRPPQVS